MLALLAGKYDEVPSAIGIASGGGLVEVLTSDSGSWTIIVTSPHGQSCVVAAGEAWKTLRRSDPEA